MTGAVVTTTKPRWYLLQLVASRAAMAQEMLKRQGFESYYPRMRTMVAVSRKRLSRAQRRRPEPVMRPVIEPLFAGYMFVRFDVATERWHEIFAIAGVRGLVCTGGTPYAIADRVIEDLVSSQVDGAIPGKTPVAAIAWAPHERVAVVEGPFAGFEGTIEELDQTGRIGLAMSLFGRKCVVRATVDDIERI